MKLKVMQLITIKKQTSAFTPIWAKFSQHFNADGQR